MFLGLKLTFVCLRATLQWYQGSQSSLFSWFFFFFYSQAFSKTSFMTRMSLIFTSPD